MSNWQSDMQNPGHSFGLAAGTFPIQAGTPIYPVQYVPSALAGTVNFYHNGTGQIFLSGSSTEKACWWVDDWIVITQRAEGEYKDHTISAGSAGCNAALNVSSIVQAGFNSLEIVAHNSPLTLSYSYENPPSYTAIKEHKSYFILVY